MSRKEIYKGSVANYRRWDAVCSILAGIHGLETLCLVIYGDQLRAGREVDAVFYPLAKIQPQIMQLWLEREAHWQPGDIPTEMYSLPGFGIRLLPERYADNLHRHGIGPVSCCLGG